MICGPIISHWKYNKKSISLSFFTKIDHNRAEHESHPHMIQHPYLSSSYLHRHKHHVDQHQPFQALWKSREQPVQPSTRPRVYGGILYVPHPDPKWERFALVRGRYSGKWSFPKGHSIEGETPMECTVREITEETGIQYLPEPTDYIRIGYGNYYIFPMPFFLPLLTRDTNEVIETRWATMEEMEHMPLNIDVNRYRKGWLKRNQSC
jgi:8-oxo-dGTP pyrophosphatase MutT (NUDIX family)